MWVCDLSSPKGYSSYRRYRVEQLKCLMAESGFFMRETEDVRSFSLKRKVVMGRDTTKICEIMMEGKLLFTEYNSARIRDAQ